MSNGDLLRMEKISKEFVGVKALKDVDFDLGKGEIVGLVGENGAGKSTLMNIVSGIHVPTRGDVYLEGHKVQILSPAIAMKHGIAMVHQHPALAPNMSGVENLFMGREKRRNGIFVKHQEMLREARSLLEEIGISFDPEKKVSDMSMAEKEAITMARAFRGNPRIMILDEVTAPLDQVEAGHLFEVILKLKSSGIGMIFIGHRLREVLDISDRIVVLRDGVNVGVLKKEETSQEEVIRLMVGEVSLNHVQNGAEKRPRGRVLLRCKDLSSGKFFSNVNLELRGGEIVGLAGLKGSGRAELAKALFGLLETDKGEIHIRDRKVTMRKPVDAMVAGIGYIPGDRLAEGLASAQSVEENINITMLDFLASNIGFLNFRGLRENAEKQGKSLQIKTPSIRQHVMYLSGGNQQKVMIAKWLARDLDVFIFDEPTRGVDVGAKAEIHRLLVDLRNQGKGIILISSELPELLRVSDRIVTMVQGEMGIEFSRRESTEEKILRSLHMEEKNHGC